MRSSSQEAETGQGNSRKGRFTDVVSEVVFKELKHQPTLNTSKTFQELRACLVQTHGSILRGWRSELDTDGDLSCDWDTFCSAATRLNFTGDVVQLFNVRPGNNKELFFEDVDPHACHLLMDTRMWIHEKFGGTMEFFQALDTSGDDQISLAEFTEACREQGLDRSNEDLQILFEGIDLDGAGLVSKDEVVIFELDKDERKEMLDALEEEKDKDRNDMLSRMYSESRSSGLPGSHRLAQRPWNTDLWDLPEEKLRQRQERRHKAHQDTLHAVALFRQHIRSTYGNEVRAWRRVLDPLATNRITKKQLLAYCRKILFLGDGAALYRGLERDTDGSMGLEELTPNHANILAAFRGWAIKYYGSCGKLWDTPPFREAEENVKLRKKIRIKDFISACLELGYAKSCYSHDNAVTGGLDEFAVGVFAEHVHHSTHEQEHIMEDLLKSLEGRRNSINRCSAMGLIGKLNVDISQPESELRLVGVGIDYHGCGFVRFEDLDWLDNWTPPVWLSAKPDSRALRELKNMLIERYHSMIQAWRRCLDFDGSNKVSWSEFVQAAERLRFRGNVAGAWRALDIDLSGWISMNEIDPQTHHLLVSFKHWAEHNFGSVGCAFRSLDKDNSKSLTFSEIRRACRQLNWEGDPRELFDALDASGSTPDEPRRQIDFDEIAFLDGYNDDTTKIGDLLSQESSESRRRTITTASRSTPVYYCSRTPAELSAWRKMLKFEPIKMEHDSQFSIDSTALDPLSFGFAGSFGPKLLASQSPDGMRRRKAPCVKPSSSPGFQQKGKLKNPRQLPSLKQSKSSPQLKGRPCTAP